MREIKFRVWDTFNERMIEQPYRFTPSSEADKIDGDDRFNTPYMYYEDWQDEEDGVRRPCHVMQFTGLKDKNGKEIYEGDIVIVPYVDPLGRLHRDVPNGKYKVLFEFGYFALQYPHEQQLLAFGCERSEGDYIPNYGVPTILTDTTVYEIIGNIYENPELVTLHT